MSYQSEFEMFVRRHRGQMVTTAAALTGGDRHLAEDLTQSALVRLYLAWGRARGMRTEAYARRVLVNCFLDHRRRAWVSRERSFGAVPDVAAPGFESDPELLAALRELPPRMRAAVVLRHVEDRSVEDVADALGCSVGTVKSQTARGLAKLREHLKDNALQGGHHV